jgi:hypothetical protein
MIVLTAPPEEKPACGASGCLLPGAQPPSFQEALLGVPASGFLQLILISEKYFIRSAAKRKGEQSGGVPGLDIVTLNPK